MNKLLRLIVYFTGIIILSGSCKGKIEETPLIPDEFIEITKSQFKSEKMKIGLVKSQAFKKKVSCTGTIVTKADGMAKISAPIEGIVTHIFIKSGQYIEKSHSLIKIGGNSVIDLQKDYAECAAKLNHLTSEYNRSRALFNENIQTEKEFLAVQSNYKSILAQYNSLKLKIASINLDTSIVKKGVFSENYLLKAPIKGYVTKMDVNLGQYIEPQLVIAEITDVNKLQLKLSVFEHEMDKVKEGQKVEFFSSASSDTKETAKIITINKTLNNTTRAMDCYAEIDELKSGTLINNQYVNADIIIAVDTVIALPKTAFINSEDKNYVLVLIKENKDGYVFRKVSVKTGLTDNNFIEVKDISQDKKILLEGAYYIE